MKKALIFAGAATALALTSVPAFAQAVPATAQADAHARIYRPLTLTATRDLNLGTIVLGPGTYTDTVSIDQAGVHTCGANLVCSGTQETATFDVTGTMDQTVTISLPSATVALVNQTQASADLTLTLDAPANVLLDNTGAASFAIGGSIDVSDTTADGVYLGTFDVEADYQ